MFEGAEVVKEGTWKYTDITECKVRVIKWHTLYGSGDYEDPPEISDDKSIECYYVLIEDFSSRGEFTAPRPGFLTINEAVEEAEACMYNNIKWF